MPDNAPNRSNSSSSGPRRRLGIWLVLIAATLGSSNCSRPGPAPQPTTQPASAPATVPTTGASARVPIVRFTDVTAESGITFAHDSGAYGDKLLPETMGGGVAFFDYDDDNDQDLLFVNSTYWPGRAPAGAKPSGLALYRADVTELSLLPGRGIDRRTALQP